MSQSESPSGADPNQNAPETAEPANPSAGAEEAAGAGQVKAAEPDQKKGADPSRSPGTKKGKSKASQAATGKTDGAVSKKAPPAKRAPLTEAEINAPTVNTLIMLGVMSISTLVLWAAGRAACNYHVPGESLTPRAVSLDERTRSAKDVGIEFASSLAGADFETAQELALGDGVRLIDEARAACGACDLQIKSRPDLASTAIVHRANSIDAIVEVRTYLNKALASTRFLGIERKERKWRVTRVFSSLNDAQLIAPSFVDPLVSPLAPGSTPATVPVIGVPSDTSAAATPPAESAPTPGVAPGSSASPSGPQAPAPVLKLNLPSNSNVDPNVQED